MPFTDDPSDIAKPVKSVAENKTDATIAKNFFFLAIVKDFKKLRIL